jgi:type II secretory pathway pseudopilin PulG
MTQQHSSLGIRISSVADVQGSLNVQGSLKQVVTSTRHAFTLLELVLALSMAVVLMVLIGGAIQFYSRDMNVRDMDIRQTQLAAAVMQMIEDDLRATLHPQPVDTAALEELLAATSGGETGGANDTAEDQDLSAAGIDSDLDSGRSN